MANTRSWSDYETHLFIYGYLYCPVSPPLHKQAAWLVDYLHTMTGDASRMLYEIISKVTELQRCQQLPSPRIKLPGQLWSEELRAVILKRYYVCEPHSESENERSRTGNASLLPHRRKYSNQNMLEDAEVDPYWLNTVPFHENFNKYNLEYFLLHECVVKGDTTTRKKRLDYYHSYPYPECSQRQLLMYPNCSYTDTHGGTVSLANPSMNRLATPALGSHIPQSPLPSTLFVCQTTHEAFLLNHQSPPNQFPFQFQTPSQFQMPPQFQIPSTFQTPHPNFDFFTTPSETEQWADAAPWPTGLGQQMAFHSSQALAPAQSNRPPSRQSPFPNIPNHPELVDLTHSLSSASQLWPSQETPTRPTKRRKKASDSRSPHLEHQATSTFPDGQPESSISTGTPGAPAASMVIATPPVDPETSRDESDGVDGNSVQALDQLFLPCIAHDMTTSKNDDQPVKMRE